VVPFIDVLGIVQVVVIVAIACCLCGLGFSHLLKDRNFLQTGLEEILSSPHKMMPCV
jgi:hypothetical protein